MKKFSKKDKEDATKKKNFENNNEQNICSL